MKTKLIFTILILVGQYVSAQNLQVLKGRIYDNSTDEPMPYATISIPSTGTGVISNEFGEFVYHIPENIQNEIIQISFLGYETWFVATDTINPGNIYNIALKRKMIQIGDVEIVSYKQKTVEKIVEQAINRIPKNYPKKQFQLKGYYRDFIRNLNTDDYNNLTEAAVIIEDNGFNTNDYKKTKIKIEQVRYNPQLAADTSLNIRYDDTVKYVPKGNIGKMNDLAMLLINNPIRNYNIKTFSFVYRFDYTFIPNHDFFMKSVIKNGSYEIYEIGFDTKISIGLMNKIEYSVEGTIHIKSDDYGILKFEYNVFRKQESFSGKLFSVNLEYKTFSGKYYLSYLAFNNYFEYSTQTFGIYRPKIEYLYQYRELFINKIITEIDQPISVEETIEKDKMLISNKVPEIPGFWDNYNFVINKKLIEE